VTTQVARKKATLARESYYFIGDFSPVLMYITASDMEAMWSEILSRYRRISIAEI